MVNLNVAVLGHAGYSKIIGKCGTTSDITLYDLKKGENTVTLIEPTRYPERLAPLFFAVSMADIALLVVEEISPEFGETIVMLDVAGIERGYIVLKNYLEPSQLAHLVKGTVVEKYTLIEDDGIALREKLLQDVEDVPVLQKNEATSGVVSIDHHFNVKGIGTVILGGVEKGRIRRHDSLTIHPGEKATVIRSIQKHDDNCEDAIAGDRVGLALKNIDADELDRGYVLSNDKTIKISGSIKGEAQLVGFWQLPIREGMLLHVGHWMQFVPARVVSISEEKDCRTPDLVLELEKELVYIPGDRAVLHYLDAGKLRVAGSITISG
jgi:selenocysteine-specific translation elongation factor